MEQHVSTEEVVELVVRRVSEVLDVDAGDIDPGARFDEDLHADSLDLVEVVEGVERDLLLLGIRAGIGDAELVTLRTVGDAAARIAASARPETGQADDPAAIAAQTRSNTPVGATIPPATRGVRGADA